MGVKSTILKTDSTRCFLLTAKKKRIFGFKVSVVLEVSYVIKVFHLL